MKNIEWVDVPNFNGELQINEQGQIRQIKVLNISDNGKGYKFVNYKGFRFYIHRVMMMSFSPTENQDKLQVNHKDFDPANNSLKNLEWVTPTENIQHSMNGEKRKAYNKKHSEKLKEMFKNGENPFQKLSDESIKKRQENRSKNVPRKEKHYCFGKHSADAVNAKLTREQAAEIRSKYIPYKYGYPKLAKEYGVSPVVINLIIKNKTYKNELDSL